MCNRSVGTFVLARDGTFSGAFFVAWKYLLEGFPSERTRHKSIGCLERSSRTIWIVIWVKEIVVDQLAILIVVEVALDRQDGLVFGRGRGRHSQETDQAALEDLHARTVFFLDWGFDRSITN